MVVAELWPGERRFKACGKRLGLIAGEILRVDLERLDAEDQVTLARMGQACGGLAGLVMDASNLPSGDARLALELLEDFCDRSETALTYLNKRHLFGGGAAMS